MGLEWQLDVKLEEELCLHTQDQGTEIDLVRTHLHRYSVEMRLAFMRIAYPPALHQDIFPTSK